MPTAVPINPVIIPMIQLSRVRCQYVGLSALGMLIKVTLGSRASVM